MPLTVGSVILRGGARCTYANTRQSDHQADGDSKAWCPLVDAMMTIKTNNGTLTLAHELVLFNTDPEARGEFAWQMQMTSGTGR